MKHLDKLKSKILRISIGMVYFVFGVLKFFPALSPAEELAKNTIYTLSLGLVPSNLGLIVLAFIETGIGLFLLMNWQKNTTINFAIIHIILTFSPLFMFPELIFGNGGFAVTLVAQYIFKNLIILSALVSLKIDILITSNSGLKSKSFSNLIFLTKK
ncbi:hypothetical protein ACNR9Q_16475 [Maribacter sp. X9]|uniref:hypothetical protein n=1 Tax=Maribacter sp. X9 TaxID=3402159 RepID=UPI003AF345B8